MLMAVDIGNTNIVIGFLEGDRIVGSYRITTKATHTSDEYGLMITQFLALSDYTADDVDDVIVCSVVPKVMYSFRASLIKFLGLEPMVVGPGVKTGMNIRLDDPKTLGSDCIADCAGAYHTYGGPVLVADFGTATTFNYVDGSGTIRSGFITTGIRTGAEALWGRPPSCRKWRSRNRSRFWPPIRSTAMQAGLYYTFLGGIERTIQQFRKEIDEPFQVVATGGLSRIFKNDTDMIDVYDSDLIFKGMAYIYSRNVK